MGKAIRVSVLMLLLCCSAHAGYIQNDTPAPPPPPPSQPVNPTQEPAQTADKTTVSGYRQNNDPGSLTQIALELLAVLPSLL